METQTPLQKAHAVMAARRAAGETITRRNPAEKFEARPTLRSACSAKCFNCVGGTNADGGYRRAIRECGVPACALYNFRPYKPTDTAADEPETESEAVE